MSPDIKFILKEHLDKKFTLNEHLGKISKETPQVLNIYIKNKLSNTPQKSGGTTGDQFFRFELDKGNIVIASMTSDGRIRVHVEYMNSDYLPHRVLIGMPSDDNGMIVQDTTINWSKKAKSILKHENWPECLAALNKAVTVASVMLS